ncbi:MAG TPA: glycosyltransferase [Nevskiaceae bacterium]|nr:glycosyltransferase [Nevskiaceae bacterium]
MTVMLMTFALGVVAELTMHWPLWRWRKVLAGIALVATALASGGMLAWQFNLCSVLLVGLGGYRILNHWRVIEARMHEGYLRRATWRTTWALWGLQLVVGGLWWAWDRWHTTGHVMWGVVGALQVAVALVLLASTIRRLRHTQWTAPAKHFADSELPTLSVAIPARNETDALQACLQSLIASNYPKLEILVLDDCSQNRRTPEIIRAYAHDGVRFVQGDDPRETWLPKNQAYNKLTHEASGELILFCGVDVRFAPDALRQVVTMLLTKEKQMMSILPERAPTAFGRFAIIQAMRYWWELAPPRRLLNRPPVISSCWIIYRQALEQTGGFKAVARSIVPEAHFAKQLIRPDAYSFMRSNSVLGLQSAKTAQDQRDTAIRTRYPQLHRRPENVVLATVLELALLVLPFVLAVAGFWLPIGPVAQVLAAVAALLLVLTYVLTARSTHINATWFACLAFPWVVLVDVALVHYSMWQYEFSVVDWKGRNICIPAMHVVPHLPRLP